LVWGVFWSQRGSRHGSSNRVPFPTQSCLEHLISPISRGRPPSPDTSSSSHPESYFIRALFGANFRAHRATRVVCPRGTHFVLPDEVATCHSVRVEFESTTQRRVSHGRTGYRRSGTAPGRAVTALPAASRPVRLYSRCRRDRGVTGQGAGNALSKVCDRVHRGKRAPRGLA
jgi:hypothetical protein